MKKHYYFEVVLLILLSISAATLAADHHFYDLVDSIFVKLSIPIHVNEIAVAYIRLIAFSGIILLSVANVFKYLHSEKRLVHWLIVSLHNTFFADVTEMKDTQKESIYRVTCYKFYEFGWKLFTTLFLLTVAMIIFGGFFSFSSQYSNFWRIVIFISILVFCTSVLCFTLMILDSWWYQWFKRLRLKDRRLKLGNNYLLGYARYEYENGIKNEKPTTLPFLIDGPINRMFVGKVFASNGVEKALDNHDINKYLKEIEIEQSLIDGLKSFIHQTPEDTYKHLESFSSFVSLGTDKKNYIKDFMKKTNTTAWDLFKVNGGKHCNHFVGFQVKDETNKIWGVVTIDVLNENLKADSNPVGFLEILGKTQDSGWLNFNLKSFSEIFSKTINPSK